MKKISLLILLVSVQRQSNLNNIKVEKSSTENNVTFYCSDGTFGYSVILSKIQAFNK